MKRILIAYDGSDAARKAYAPALELPRGLALKLLEIEAELGDQPISASV